MIALLCLLAAPPALAAGAGPPERLIQVGIEPKAERLSFSCEGPAVVTDAQGQEHPLSAKQGYRLEPDEEGLNLGPLPLGAQATLRPQNPADAIVIGPRRYRGSLLLRRNEDGTVTVVDELGIEDYLLGVLPHEMDPSWPLEALKAQAVVARTFAYTHMGKFRKAGYDLTADTRSQMFGGAGSEAPSIRTAVEGTRGEVLGYDGRILDVYYHACCGGHTADEAAIWGGAPTPRPLRGVKDNYCRISPLARWTAYFDYSDILAAVERTHLTAGKLRRFELGRIDFAGYARNFLIRIGARTLTVRANDFRNWIGNTELKSTRISRLRRLTRGIEFIGTGSGHGVGLCQWGARAQAEQGRGYEKILSFYFPGSVLSVISE